MGREEKHPVQSPLLWCGAGLGTGKRGQWGKAEAPMVVPFLEVRVRVIRFRSFGVGRKKAGRESGRECFAILSCMNHGSCRRTSALCLRSLELPSPSVLPRSVPGSCLGVVGHVFTGGLPATQL